MKKILAAALSHIRTLSLVSVLAILCQSAAAEDKVTTPSPDKAIINMLMDDFHDAADKGDSRRYLNHFAENGVFMGTDDWERWPLDEFSEYVNTHFKDGKGWSYTPLERHIEISQDRNTAWFDEITYSSKWGRFRGTGVLVKTAEQWKIAHYSLSMLVPNDAWEEISKIATATYDKVKQAQEKNE